MAKRNAGSNAERLGRPPRGWVRKNLHIDQRKLDAALDAIALRKELSGGIQRLRAAGGLKDIYQD